MTRVSVVFMLIFVSLFLSSLKALIFSQAHNYRLTTFKVLLCDALQLDRNI